MTRMGWRIFQPLMSSFLGARSDAFEDIWERKSGLTHLGEVALGGRRATNAFAP